MKTHIATLLLTIFTTAVFAGTETNSTYLKILQASNNVSSVISALPDVEKLWPQDPSTYLKSVSQASHILGGSQNDTNARQALSVLFEGLMQKPCPTNEDQIGSWVESKSETAVFCFNFNEFKTDKSKWLEIANFIGEIRSQIIPNYKNKGVLLNGFGFTDQQIAQNEKFLAEDSLQARLRSVNASLTFFLGNCSYYFAPNNPTNANFIKQISDAAHLSPDEQAKL